MANKTILNTKDLIHGFGVTLYVTESCNLKCTYCYQGNCHSNKTMTFELACDIIDKAINKTIISFVTVANKPTLIKKAIAIARPPNLGIGTL